MNIKQIINILKDCKCPIYEKDKKIWNMGVQRAITYLEFELQSIKLRAYKGYRNQYLKNKERLSKPSETTK